MSFSDPGIGRKQRQENCHLYHNKNIQQNWTPILEVTRQFRINKKTQVQILRRQFPLRPAAAKTIHRCQGDTLDAAVVDFPSSTKEHMHYVGLSRVRNSSNLYIMNLNEQKIKVNENVAQEMERLRTEATLSPRASLQNTGLSLFTIISIMLDLYIYILMMCKVTTICKKLMLTFVWKLGFVQQI